jgi:hypothetical protein
MAKFTSKIPPTNIMKNKKFKNKTILDISIVRTKFKEMFFCQIPIYGSKITKIWLNLPMDNHHFDYVTKSIKWNSVNYDKYIIQQILVNNYFITHTNGV